MSATQAQIDRIDVRIMPDPEEGPVTPDGPLRSIQEAELTMPRDTLEALWNPATLERLARAYWRYLNTDLASGCSRSATGRPGRYVVLGWRRLVLLSFRLPEYDVGPGLRPRHLADRAGRAGAPGRGRGYLRIDVRRLEPEPRARRGAGPDPRDGLELLSASFAARAGSRASAPSSTRRPSCASTCSSRGASCARSQDGDLPPLRPGREAAYEEAERPPRPAARPSRATSPPSSIARSIASSIGVSSRSKSVHVRRGP